MNGAAWLRAQVAAKGAELAAWPDATRAAALSLDAAAWTAAGIMPEGGAGGGAPCPYPDKGHLRNSHDQDGAPDGAYVGDALPRRDDGAETPANAVRDGTHASAGEVLARLEAQRRRSSSSERAPAGDRRRPWDKRTRDHEHELVLRSAIEAATGRTIRDGKGVELECNADGWVFQHRQIVDAFRFRVHTCKARGRCPHCGRAYGLEQASELHSLLGAASSRRRQALKEHDPIGWAFVVTMPRAVSRELGRLADDPRERKALRAGVSSLVRIARDYVAGMLRADPRELGAAINVHWWASDNPTRGGADGWHWHAHVMVPNVSRDGRDVRRRAKFTPAELEAGRARLAALLAAAWPAIDAANLRPNAHARYFLADEKGARRWRHRTRYDARHPFADLLKVTRPAGPDRAIGQDRGGRPELAFSIDAAPELERFALRVEDLQSLKTRRYVGWLVPGTRKKVGLVKPERDDDGAGDEWVALEDGYRRIRRWTSGGLELVRFDRFTGEAVAEVVAELVDFDSQGPPVAWGYDEARDTAREGLQA